MPSKPWKKVFDGPGARVRGLGSLDVEEWLFVGDPLGGDTIDARPVPGTYYVELALAEGRNAAARAVLHGTTPSSHRLIGHVTVDAGRACFAIGRVDSLTDADREALLGMETAHLGKPPWLVAFTAGWGDGHYPVFAADADARVVAVWIDFKVIEISETIKALDKKVGDAEMIALFDAFDLAVQSRSPLPDIRPLEALRKRNVHAKLFPRLAALLAADRLSDSVVFLARRWLAFPQFHAVLASTEFSAARWQELHFGQALFRGAALEPVLARAIARSETIPIEVRFALGDPEDLWPIAAARLDAHAIGFFTRPDAACATVEPALRATVEKALHERGCVNAVMSLRRGTPPKLPG